MHDPFSQVLGVSRGLSFSDLASGGTGEQAYAQLNQFLQQLEQGHLEKTLRVLGAAHDIYSPPLLELRNAYSDYVCQQAVKYYHKRTRVLLRKLALRSNESQWLCVTDGVVHIAAQSASEHERAKSHGREMVCGKLLLETSADWHDGTRGDWKETPSKLTRCTDCQELGKDCPEYDEEQKYPLFSAKDTKRINELMKLAMVGIVSMQFQRDNISYDKAFEGGQQAFRAGLATFLAEQMQQASQYQLISALTYEYYTRLQSILHPLDISALASRVTARHWQTFASHCISDYILTDADDKQTAHNYLSDVFVRFAKI
jgi:hypothetical protein